jgi:hypothetical protein
LFSEKSLMQAPRCCGVVITALLVLPFCPSAAGPASHPLDPRAAPAALATDDPFADYVPLLDRVEPFPSFLGDEAEDLGSMDAEPGTGAQQMDHSAMGHGVSPQVPETSP